MKNIICKLFGHITYEQTSSYDQGAEYMKVWGGTTDGIGRKHLFIKAECGRCGKDFHVGKIHVPSWAE